MTRSITFTTAHWKIPSIESAFDGYLEGGPTDEERQKIITDTQARRSLWSPSPEAWVQFEDIKDTVGKVVQLQQWDPIMALLDDEGPYPLHAHCIGLQLLTTDGGELQAYLLLRQVRCEKTPMGYDGRGQLTKGRRGEYLMPLAKLYMITWNE